MAKTSRDARRIIKRLDKLGKWERISLDVFLVLAALACLIRWIIGSVQGR